MTRRSSRSPRTGWRSWLPTPSIMLAGAALFIALGGSAVAATGLIKAGDIAPGAVTGKAIRKGAVTPQDLSASTRALITGGSGSKGETGSTGAPGSNGANGPNGANGTNGIDGTDGTDGVKGTNGTNGTNGTVAPLSARQGPTALPTGAAATTVVELAVPAGNYVVLAKTQLFQTGAGDSVECLLKSGTTTLDQTAMKTLPALASVPASLQSVTATTSPAVLSVQCAVSVANGSANYSSLIAIPTA
jgi:hypothetical protein